MTSIHVSAAIAPGDRERAPAVTAHADATAKEGGCWISVVTWSGQAVVLQSRFDCGELLFG
jgi:hypothetical protein